MAQRVLLINPPIYDFAAYDLFNKPLGLLYLGAFLREAGYEVELIDTLDRRDSDLAARFGAVKVKANGTGKYHSEIIDRPDCLGHIPRNYRRYGLPIDILADKLAGQCDSGKPSAVLVTSMMTYWYPGVADTIALIREIIPDTPIALGGVYGRLMPDHARRVCRPDVLMTDSGFLPVLEWLNGLVGIKRDYQGVRDDICGWPIPAYDLYRQLDYLTCITSVGCPNRCDYCASGFLQPTMRQFGASLFVEQLRELVALLPGDQKVYNVAFMDDALLAGAERHIVPIMEKILELNLPFRFHCPNGLHCRLITEEVAELMYGCGFEMIRLSYESSDQGQRWQRASDNKVSDRDFHRAIDNLIKAGFERGQLEAYILSGLPGQEISEAQVSAEAVHQLGLKVCLCQYSPIAGTRLFEEACGQYNIDPDEPLMHNNSILPAFDKSISYEEFGQFKDYIIELNQTI